MKPIHKFNNGEGATLCNSCRAIISDGFADYLVCNECKKKSKMSQIIKDYEEASELIMEAKNILEWYEEEDPDLKMFVDNLREVEDYLDTMIVNNA